MAEGGYFPWKVQKVVERGPVGNYGNIADPLPSPPKGMKWNQDPKTREFSLVAEEEQQQQHNSNNKDNNNRDCSKEEKTTKEADNNNSDNTTTAIINLNDLALEENGEDEWELLSDHRVPSFNSGLVLINKRGSGEESVENGSSTNHTITSQMSVPIVAAIPVPLTQSSQQQTDNFETAVVAEAVSSSNRGHHNRTPSSSTIDSSDALVVGPLGKGVLGVDYAEHVVLPTDTLQGICLAYKTTATKLRQANHFSGNSLLLAPKKLVIPLSQKAIKTGYLRVQDTDSKEYKIHAFQVEFSYLSFIEAKAYLELADWVLQDAIQSAREDVAWEKEQDDSTTTTGRGSTTALKSGEIRITMQSDNNNNNNNNNHYYHGGKSNRSSGISSNAFGLKTRGAGFFKSVLGGGTVGTPTKSSSTNHYLGKHSNKIADSNAICEINRTVKVDEAYQVSPQHKTFGVEMQPLVTKNDSSSKTNKNGTNNGTNNSTNNSNKKE